MLGFHYQAAVDGHLRALEALPAGAPVKAVDRVDLLSAARAANPRVFTILRHWYDRGQIFQGNYEPQARKFFDSFIDGTFLRHARDVDAIEEFNEYNGPMSARELAERIAWAQTVTRIWATEYQQARRELGHIRLIVGNAAVGNDVPIPVLKTIVQYRQMAGIHCYTPVRDGIIHADAWPFYAGRWIMNDAAARAEGVDVRQLQWVVTEGGPVGYQPPASLNPNDGWRHSRVYGGSVSGLLRCIDDWLDKAEAWNKANGGRLIGMVLFTTGGGDQWREFEIKQPEMSRIAEHVRARPAPDKPPDAPPDKPPGGGDRWAKVVYLVPPGSTYNEEQKILSAARASRSEVTFSADAAFAPQAKTHHHTVIIYDAGRWAGGLAALRAWASAKYGTLPEIVERRLL